MPDFILILMAAAVIGFLAYIGYRAYRSSQSKGSIGKTVGGIRPFDDRKTRNR